MELQKLNAAIEAAEARLREHYAKIGEEMYKHYVEVGKEPELCADNFALVAASMAEVNDLKKQMADMHKVTCPTCNEEILATAKFCHECGAPVVAKEHKLVEEIKDGYREVQKVYKEAHAEALAFEEYPR